MKKLIKKIFRLRKFLILLFLLAMIFIIIPFSINKYINFYSGKYIASDYKRLPRSYVALVPGAQVLGNYRISQVLYDRLIRALVLYRTGKVRKFLLSGDHGQKDYDEVNTMKYYLLKHGVRGSNIFLDHAGFDTYDSVIRAKKVFGVKNVIIVTQRFHLPRAIYIARKNGLNAYGYVADRFKYKSMKYYKTREFYAKVKAFLEVLINTNPKFLGKKIPVTGDGKYSWD